MLDVINKLRSILLIGSIRGGGLLATFLISVVIARNFSKEAFGQYATALSVLMILSIPLVGGLQTYVVREVAKNRSNNQKSLSVLNKAQRIALIYSSIIVSALLILICSGSFSSTEEIIGYLFILVLAIYPTAIIQNYSAFCRGKGWNRLGVVFEFLLKPVAMLALLFILIISTKDVSDDWIYFSYIISIALCATIISFWVRSNMKAKWKLNQRVEWRKIYIRNGLGYLTLIGGLQILLINVDVLIVSYYLSADDVAIYKVALQFGIIAGFGLTVVNLILQPIISELFHRGKIDELKNELFFYTAIIQILTIVLCILLYFYREDLVVFLFGPGYEESAELVPYILFGQLVNVLAGSVGVILNMTNNQGYVFRGLLLAIITLMIALNLLVPSLGVVGAGIGYCLALAVWNLYLVLIVKMKLGIVSASLLHWIFCDIWRRA